MNHVFRIIWSFSRHAFVVVSEQVSARGRQGGRGALAVGSRPGLFWLTPICAALAANTAWAAGVEVASGNTAVFNAPNGVQVIDIATANGAGVSHNRYIQYNVDPSGQILNNNSAFTRAGALQSQLGGQIVPNVNLTNEARVILNEVVAPNRSSLRGYTEVVGGKADVIVANPYGITCSGCGFINSDRATLTTGVPTIGADGRVAGFTVNQGDILVEGNGIDAKNQKVLDLVARSVKIDGQLNGQDVALVAGANDYGYANRETTARASSGDTPLYAIDSTALGGMYANRIKILATEGGVGVRMRGEAAATGDDFTLSASGKIEINTRLSAERDLALSSSTSGDAIVVEGANTQLSAKRDLALSASSGATRLDEATLTANRDLNVTAATLSDTSSTGKKRYAGRDTRIQTQGATTLAGTTWGAGNDLSVQAGSLTVTNTGNLYSGADGQAASKALTLRTTSGDLKLTDANVQSTGALKLDSAAALSVGSATTIKSTGDYELKAARSIDNAGKVSGSAGGKVNAGTTLSNSNLLHANGSLAVEAASIGNSSTAGMSSLNELSLKANTNIDNHGALYAAEHLNLQAGGQLSNYASGTLSAANKLDIRSARLVNNGAIVSFGDAYIKTTQSFVNETLWSGGILTKRDGAVAYGGVISEDKIANEGSFDKGMNAWLYDEKYSFDEQLVGLTLSELQNLQKAQIIAYGAGSKLTLDYGSSGLNRVGVISAPNVEITGTGTFTNQELALYHYEKTLRWIRIDDESSGDDDFIAWARTDSTVYCYNGAPANCSGRDDDLPNSPDDDNYNWDEWSPGAGWTKTRHLSGGGFPSVLGDEAREMAIQGGVFRDASVIGRSGAGIFATNLSITGTGTLVNDGSPWPDDQARVAQTTLVTGSANGPAGGASTINLPSNPNGDFVISKNPNTKYLVETNPNYGVGSNFVGSDYLAKRYGFNPDDVQKRLGDANYEAYLIRQQLIQKTGSNVINGYANEVDQMQRLMDQAYGEGQKQGLQFGKPLTAEQAANLTQDIVWMEETEVQGQKVLVPRVYLAASTVAAIASGAVIAADNLDIAGGGLKNTGGTIEGRDSLSVKTTGDITNTSGTIKGGNVSLTSTEGSIRNETLAVGQGDGTTYTTALGKNGTIESNNNLSLDAAKDVTVLGADVKAGGDASIAAGGDVTFDTIVDKNTATSYTERGGFLGGTSTRTSVSTEKNLGSNLSTGGNLTVKSGGDTTIAGSNADIGGNLDAQTGGSFKVVARQDKETVETQTSTSGVGVGGGLYGSQKTTVNDFTGTNKGSTLNVGGNANVKSDKAIVLQGSDANIGGDANLEGKEGIAILDGLDEKRTSTRVETTTFLKVDSSSGAEAKAQASAVGLQSEASAEASAKASANLKLAETSVTTTKEGKNTSVASNLKVGGNLGMKSDGTVTVQGSNVEAGGDLAIDAKDVQVLTGRNEEWRESETTTTSVGIYNDAEAKAGASASAGVSGGGVASGQAQAGADAGSTTTAGVRHEHSQESSYSLTNSSSTLKSGGNMSVTAKDTATFQGANVESGGDMNIQAKDIRNVAAQDVSRSSSSAETHTAGVYLGTGASAQASANGNSQGQGDASAIASAEASAGLRYAYESEKNSEGSITQVTNSFKSGGNFTRQAQDTIVDQGTQVEAAGNITQSARVIRDEAVSDSSWSSSDAQSHDARVGVYAGAEANASASGGADASAGVGVKASYQGSISSESEQQSTAVTSRFKAGGDISSTSKEQTTLVGTQFESGGDTTIDAGSLDYQAAKDTSSAKGSSHDINVEAKVAIAGNDASLDAGYDMAKSSESASTARTGSIQSAGNLTIRTRGDATFTGTELSAGGKTSIDSGGNVTFNEARDTANSSSLDLSVGVSASSSKTDTGGKENEGELGLGVGYGTASSSTARVGSISGGQGVSISSGGNTTLVGTQIESGAQTDISAGGKVNLQEAVSTSSNFAVRAETSVSGSSSSEPAKPASEGASKGAANKPAEDAGEDDDGPIGASGLELEVGSSREATKVNIQSAGGTSIRQGQR
ncbi:hypothetical protein Pstr01_13610 [Pseudomonas straminea]|uniref:Filamentous hemagglutinin family N-terminal domain-containing protein n=1 Tax=Pseudomonas straminea TaxID=47882 RepID=A0A1I1TL33_PSEOC|nr:hemagglutinin repeat-containing protein [Pseudomonas straminea]GLX13122.1 hypothetical protein Pstr01_13610 [Pseudomonas straminea]SFD59372.1 filamentous hemagglutinin family N-terminal domain-containing protein [Pseudomonas straminea]